ncbi:MAG: transglycosylase family protein [Actinoplanes sp.]
MAQIRKQSLRVLGLAFAGAAGTVALLSPASAAQAKSSVNWDAVAQCESGGNWSINTGNGYYGGLQFSRSTWKSYGGGKYASTANKASRSQQIRIAEKVLDGQGIGAWPVCGKKAGSSKSYQAKNASGAKSSSTKSTAKKPSRTTTHKATHKATTKAKSTARAQSTGRSYTIKSGDTLAKIAAAQHVRGGWRALYQLNSGEISNPNLIFPGQRLAV